MTGTAIGQLFVLLSLGMWLMACNGPRPPVFKRLERVRVDLISTGRVTILADAVCDNPNAIGGRLKATDVVVEAKEVAVATVVQGTEQVIPPLGEFRVPLAFTAKPRELLQTEGSGLIGGVVNALLKQEVALHYSGTLRVAIAGITFELPIDERVRVALE